MSAEQQAEFDYIVVGSGAGGGPVAANLAAAGFEVLLIEAGHDYSDLNYDVPAFHGQATQDPEMAWEFFVKHYSAPGRNSKDYDSKYDEEHRGVFYPRAATLGGCTGHHALITVYPHDSDWKEIAQIAEKDDPTDRSWEPDRMRKYFQRIERCGYLPRAGGRGGDAQHGYDGWLPTDVITDLITPEQLLAGVDAQLIQAVLGAFNATAWDIDFNPDDPGAIDRALDKLEAFLENAPTLREVFSLGSLRDKKEALQAHIKGQINSYLDPNRYPMPPERREGVFLIPLSVSPGERKRVGTRERIKQVQAGFPQSLTIWCNTFVTRVVFEGKKAVGVESIRSPKYYKATPRPEDPGARARQVVRAKREVIVAGGSFNTPQLLMLSGIGGKEHLAEHGIPQVCDLPAVGRYLQDRYELGLISEYPKNFKILGDYRFRKPEAGEPPDAALEEWKANHDGLYATNGAIISVIRRSSPGLTDPDLFLFGLPAAFRGYFLGYADTLEEHRNRFTWAILKGHTRNKGGHVRLASNRPEDRPEINFKYFDEGTDEEGCDLNAMVQGVSFARQFLAHLGVDARPLVKGRPAPDLDDREQVIRWIKGEAWGHHACGTCRIGPRDDTRESVLDTNFRVKGVQGLRVVDASVFPSIPGFFIVTPIYMVAEKASESILRDAGWKPDGAPADGLNLPRVG